MQRVADNLLTAFLWRYFCHALMLGFALYNEAQPAPSLSDLVLSIVPRVAWIHRWNYHFWLLLYLPLAVWLWRTNRDAFVHFLYLGGVLSLLRGICIPLTHLGPVHGPDINAGRSGRELAAAWLVLINPFSTLLGNAAGVYLTKDLFFSGHTATTFLLWLYCRGRGPIGAVALVAHLLVVAIVFLSHLHYTIDVVGAWAITYLIYSIVIGRWPIGRQQSSIS